MDNQQLSTIEKGHSDREVKTLADSIPQLVWMAEPDGWIFWYNRRWYEYTGTTPEEMTGWGWQSVHDPAMLPQVMSKWQSSIQTGQSFDMEFPLRRADGDFRWFLTRVAPLRDDSGEVVRWYGTNTDITEVKESERLLRTSQERLRQSEDRLRIALDGAQMGIWDWNLVNGELVWSDRCRQLFGLPQEAEITYQAFLDAIHVDDRASIDRIVRDSLERRRDYSAVMRVPWKDGNTHWLLCSGRVLYDDAGRKVRMSGVAQDITERQRVEERVRQAQKLESLGLLAGGVAHDFNNLLTGILGGSGMALEMIGEQSPVYSLLRTVLLSAERAAELTRQMLAYSGKGQSLLQLVDLSQKVRKTVPLVEHFVSKKIRVTLNLSEDLPPIEADESQIEQVVMNLLTNAGEAIGDQHGTIEIITGIQQIDEAQASSAAMKGTELEPGCYATLIVRDTGCGMDEAQQLKMFDPFFTTKATGRGLGLAAIHGIVRGHKGSIQVTSKKGEGTAFRVLLPAVPDERIRGNTAAETPAVSRKFHGQTVLVVDDEKIVRDVASAALRQHGFQVMLAESGGQAIDCLKRYLDQISLILLDLSMPGLSGRETLAFIRSIQPDVPILISSGFSEADVFNRFEGQTISGIIQKPYKPPQLIAAVASALNS